MCVEGEWGVWDGITTIKTRGFDKIEFSSSECFNILPYGADALEEIQTINNNITLSSSETNSTRQACKLAHIMESVKRLGFAHAG